MEPGNTLQVFQGKANTVARTSIAGALLLVLGGSWVLWAAYWSPYTTRVGLPREQPVPFSHKHHVYGLGIDCRYCHSLVEKSAVAGVPPTETCMTCHSQLWTDAPLLAPVRQSLAQGLRLRWNRVHDLPDFVFFNHSIHVRKGIGCSTCHGPVDQMPLMWQQNTLYMRWCLGCHRHPEKFIRPANEVYDMSWQPPPDQEIAGRELLTRNHVRTSQLTDCTMCHR